jgi:hypothetical protein
VKVSAYTLVAGHACQAEWLADPVIRARRRRSVGVNGARSKLSWQSTR